MGSFFSPPKPPSPPRPAPAPRPIVMPPPPAPLEPPKPPPEVDKSEEERKERQAILARKRSGRRSTIMTGPLGDTSPAGAYKKKLLGD